MTQQQNSSFFTLGSANKPLPTLTTVQDAANTPVYEGQTQMPFQVKKKKHSSRKLLDTKQAKNESETLQFFLTSSLFIQPIHMYKLKTRMSD